MNLSLRRPENQPLIDYRGDDAAWKKYQEALKGIPKDFDVPMIIGGQEIRTAEKIESFDPSTNKLFCTAQKATRRETDMAIEAALGAKAAWASLPPENRILKFLDLAQVLYNRRHEICAVAAHECGYNAVEVSGGWGEMIDFIRFNAYYYYELHKTQLGPNPIETNSLALRPLKGFTSAVTPFNFPIAIGYNLPTVMALCGNTVVWKTSSDTPMVSWMLMKAIEEAAFPPGVINMITGPGRETMPPVIEHPELTALNFTGGYDTARFISDKLYTKEIERFHFPRFVAETGGKDFLVIDKDCDVWDVAACIIAGAFGRSGQKCSANSLVLPHESIWPDLKEALQAQMKKFKVGNPLERDADMGPVINRSAYETITGFIKRGLEDSKVSTVWGGEFSDAKGLYIQPTIFEVAPNRHELLNVEIFGPVTAVHPYKNFDDALDIIKSNTYRLTGSVWSNDEYFLEKTVPILREYAGNFYINRKTTGANVDQQPFGGDGGSGTNCKAGGIWYLLQFISQGTVSRRHARVLNDPGIWGWK
ncbi:MAG: aldehyde dehydrogenase family protein [Candidatus Eisenbacteria bacterium]|uniref:L-glutamate gamma-semialdehyde dehydrogenase n=1 Tax=Eiseniibacteriota bacterium TaxID=2212470 RepID=A0A948RZ80_UNCEI|nr:aldehyde dehydrogenase family protein [Candidatus Eisenbacteria bacterium]MBU1948319.1 aldehyde dehydrogenase family protein [Candidatus Eisenbacteria bacterium]MBU2693111.1 aldehyde dehydrogenase family protein [Candidatus Eisenbacteria bacterium]